MRSSLRTLACASGFAGSILTSSMVVAQVSEGTPVGVPPGGSTAPTAPAASAPGSEAHAPVGQPAAAPPAYYAEPAPEPRWPLRQGFTLELGLGPAYTAVGKSSRWQGGFGYGGASLSLGGFVSPRVAISGRVTGTTFFNS